VTLAFLNFSWYAFANGLEFGGIFALMAVGIGLVFGVLRLVNFAYGQLIMAGGFALAFGAQWGLPNWLSVLFCFGVVLVLSLAMDRVVFRPLRGHSPAVMLVATFAVAFILQSIALLAFGSYGKTASEFAFLSAPWYIGGVAIPKIAVIAIVTAAVCLGLLQVLLTRTPLGLHMRAASMDFRTAQLLGVRANRVITGAVVISALFAAIAAVMLSVAAFQITSTFGLYETIYVLAGVVVGGMNRPVPATLGGFTIGFAVGFLGGVLPADQSWYSSQYLPSIIFTAVIVVLLLRPNGLFTRGGVAVERL
jgi:branched-chain amino acid transport system permease protein